MEQDIKKLVTQLQAIFPRHWHDDFGDYKLYYERKEEYQEFRQFIACLEEDEDDFAQNLVNHTKNLVRKNGLSIEEWQLLGLVIRYFISNVNHAIYALMKKLATEHEYVRPNYAKIATGLIPNIIMNKVGDIIQPIGYKLNARYEQRWIDYHIFADRMALKTLMDLFLEKEKNAKEKEERKNGGCQSNIYTIIIR